MTHSDLYYLVASMIVLWSHFIGDFILQTDSHENNKWKCNVAMLEHVAMYMIPFAIFGALLPNNVFPITLDWMVVNACAHFIIDWVSSRLTTMCIKSKKRWLFFLVTEADQTLHLSFLLGSYWLMVPTPIT